MSPHSVQIHTLRQNERLRKQAKVDNGKITRRSFPKATAHLTLSSFLTKPFTPSEKHRRFFLKRQGGEKWARKKEGGAMFGLLWWVIVGLIAGWVTGKIMGGQQGVLMDIVLGIAGAIVGGWIMSALGFASHGGTIYTILVAIGGAVVLTWIYRMITRGRGRGTGEGGLRKVA
jgi:uncharacterized membrane protein YeaQ/YmgE (transglycosylase-associated protein family)